MVILKINLRLSAEEVVRRTIPFHACLERFCSDEIVSIQYYLIFDDLNALNSLLNYL